MEILSLETLFGNPAAWDWLFTALTTVILALATGSFGLMGFLSGKGNVAPRWPLYVGMAMAILSIATICFISMFTPHIGFSDWTFAGIAGAWLIGVLVGLYSWWGRGKSKG